MPELDIYASPEIIITAPDFDADTASIDDFIDQF